MIKDFFKTKESGYTLKEFISWKRVMPLFPILIILISFVIGGRTEDISLMMYSIVTLFLSGVLTYFLYKTAEHWNKIK